MQLKKNDEIELNITDLTSEGSAIGRKDGVPIFVRGGVPGDAVTVHLQAAACLCSLPKRLLQTAWAQTATASSAVSVYP